MTKSNHLGAALTAVSLIAVTAGCAGPDMSRPRSASIFGGKVDTANIGLATRAQMALAQNDLDNAIPLAERAVEKSPRDAGFRALLGNCYLAAGRFASAEGAYRDSLSLVAAQPQVVLKLALIQIAQGKNDDARLLLAEAQSMLDPADTGLALALAGDSAAAVALLEGAARSRLADARTRQNLALAYALSGDWTQARNVAAQDVPADQLDARIQQWMQLAQPARASDQVAAFIGIQPVAGDPGLPVRLALHTEEGARQAAAEPVATPAFEGVTAPQPVAAATPFADLPAIDAQAEPAMLATAEPVPAVLDALPEGPQAAMAPVSLANARPALSPAAVRLAEPPVRAGKVAAKRASAKGNSGVVVQLGAFSSRERIAVAWDRASSKYGSLNDYTPVTARFSGAKGTVYRLAVRGFDSEREAVALCQSLKRAGRDCFVRSASGDAPVQFASRR